MGLRLRGWARPKLGRGVYNMGFWVLGFGFGVGGCRPARANNQPSQPASQASKHATTTCVLTLHRCIVSPSARQRVRKPVYESTFIDFGNPFTSLCSLRLVNPFTSLSSGNSFYVPALREPAGWRKLEGRAHGALQDSTFDTQHSTLDIQNPRRNTQHVTHTTQHSVLNTQHSTLSTQHSTLNTQQRVTRRYRGTSLIRNCHPYRTFVGP